MVHWRCINGMPILRNTHTAEHYFSKICGIYIFHGCRTDPSVYGININIGCFDSLDLVVFRDVQVADGVSLSLEHQRCCGIERVRFLQMLLLC